MLKMYDKTVFYPLEDHWIGKSRHCISNRMCVCEKYWFTLSNSDANGKGKYIVITDYKGFLLEESKQVNFDVMLTLAVDTEYEQVIPCLTQKCQTLLLALFVCQRENSSVSTLPIKNDSDAYGLCGKVCLSDLLR